MTTTMVAASRRGDLNLNHAPLPDYEEQVKEGLKQAMVEHDTLFKHQVLPLFRLVDFPGYTNLFLELQVRISRCVGAGAPSLVLDAEENDERGLLETI